MYIPTRRLIEKCLKVIETKTGDRFFWVESVDKFLKRDRAMTRKKRFIVVSLLLSLIESDKITSFDKEI